MKVIFFTFFILLAFSSYSQDEPKSDPSALRNINSVPLFLDSLRTKILLDTLKHNPKDIVNTSSGAINSHSYSSLFFINMRYQYKLDIITGTDVLAFCNEILIANKIESINIMNEKKSKDVFGINGKNGTIVIQIKESAVIDFNVAGLKKEKYRGNNFGLIKID